MNDMNVSSFLTSGTYNSAILFSLAILGTNVVPEVSAESTLEHNAELQAYIESTISSSYSSANLSVEMAENEDVDIESTLMAVYDSIASSQVPIEAEFEEILESNFWDLCEV